MKFNPLLIKLWLRTDKSLKFWQCAGSFLKKKSRISSDKKAKQTYEPWHEISNNLVCATSKGSDQPAHMGRLIRAFAGRFTIL